MSIDTMSHEQAASSKAVERYVLGELTPEERDAFEGHYFDCRDCYERVKLEMQFLGHARQVLDPEPEKGWLARMMGDLRRPAPAFACALLLFTLGMTAYQQSVITDIRRPRALANYFLPGPNKGTEKPVRVPRKTTLSLNVGVTPVADFVSYRARILAESGKVKYTLPVPTPSDSSVTIGLPADDLDAGKYSIQVQGLPREGAPVEVGIGSFDLEFTD